MLNPRIRSLIWFSCTALLYLGLCAAPSALLGLVMGAYGLGLNQTIAWAARHPAQWALAPLVLFLLRRASQRESPRSSPVLTPPSLLAWGAWASHACGASVGRESLGLRLGSAWGTSLLRACQNGLRHRAFGRLHKVTEGFFALNPWVPLIFAASGLGALFGTPFSAIVMVYEGAYQEKWGLNTPKKLPRKSFIHVTQFFLAYVSCPFISHFSCQWFATHFIEKADHASFFWPKLPAQNLFLNAKLYVTLGIAMALCARFTMVLQSILHKKHVGSRLTYLTCMALTLILYFAPLQMGLNNLGLPLFMLATQEPFTHTTTLVALGMAKTLLTLCYLKIGFLGGEFTPFWAAGTALSAAFALGNIRIFEHIFSLSTQPQTIALCACVGGIAYCLRCLNLVWTIPFLCFELFGWEFIPAALWTTLGCLSFNPAYGAIAQMISTAKHKISSRHQT